MVRNNNNNTTTTRGRWRMSARVDSSGLFREASVTPARDGPASGAPAPTSLLPACSARTGTQECPSGCRVGGSRGGGGSLLLGVLRLAARALGLLLGELLAAGDGVLLRAALRLGGRLQAAALQHLRVERKQRLQSAGWGGVILRRSTCDSLQHTRRIQFQTAVLFFPSQFSMPNLKI